MNPSQTITFNFTEGNPDCTTEQFRTLILQRNEISEVITLDNHHCFKSILVGYRGPSLRFCGSYVMGEHQWISSSIHPNINLSIGAADYSNEDEFFVLFLQNDNSHEVLMYATTDKTDEYARMYQVNGGSLAGSFLITVGIILENCPEFATIIDNPS